MRLCWALLLLVVPLLPPSQSQNKNEPRVQPYSEPEVYRVYSALLPAHSVWAKRGFDRLILKEETTSASIPGGDCFPRGKDFAGSWADVLADYKKENRTPRSLSRNFSVQVPYDLVPGKEIGSFFKDRTVDGWKRFYSHYPNSGGYIQFSAVGFNEGQTKALVYVAVHCGWLCGHGSYVFLEKRNGTWATVSLRASRCEWIS